ncbi:MAG: hypothetical protein JHC95_23750, partial [Solirubrobacteraceae bacterium]|nr:hypothetical protein [Solirubrobacteraceae bacterium]
MRTVPMSLARFICRDDEERAWLLDMHRRMIPVERMATLVVVVVLVGCIPWFPLLAIPPMVLAGVLFFAGSYSVRKVRRLEPLLAGWFLATALIMVAVVVNANAHPVDGGAVSVGSALLIWPLLGACGALPTRIVACCAAWCCALVLVGCFAMFPSESLAYPPLVAVPIGMLIATAVISSAVRRASMEHRTAA